MNCPKCGTPYEKRGDSDSGFIRSICICEKKKHCRKCKASNRAPVNQAALNFDGEVINYSCANHGHMEGEDFPVKLMPTDDEIGDPESRSGMLVEGHAWLVRDVNKNKREYLRIIKTTLGAAEVKCVACGLVHQLTDRVLETNNEANSIFVVCPNCNAEGYQIL